ncbi:MAG: NUDIX hydrolase [Archangium sp.]|nr:NUDIX hydrolase [Archangium sp.]MDP3573739.1 NUDIX hydrolase [Archangium sp.]
MANALVTDLDVVEDFTATGRCDEGFLHIRRLRVRNLRADGSKSDVYRVDVVDRPRLDAVAVLLFRRGDQGLEFLTRQNLRPAAHFRHEKVPNVPDGRSHLFCEEIVAGLLETTDQGLPGVRQRAVEETFEEAGFRVPLEAVALLGPPFFVAPGIISEKIFLTAVDVTGLVPAVPEGDGSPLEEGGATWWRTLASLESALFDGTIQDAKTELALRRFLARQPASSSVVISASTSVSV